MKKKLIRRSPIRILINFSTLKTGGGQNVGLNFLQCLDNLEFKDCFFHFVVVKDSELEKVLKKQNKYKYSLMPRNPVLRILKEVLYGYLLVRKNKIDIIYTYFGVGLYPKYVPQVSGAADSNIFFPEINFWSEYSGLQKVFRRIVDFYRIHGMKKMTAVIFENKIMEERAKVLFNIQKTKLILPSINVSKSESTFSIAEKTLKKKNTGLFFCGWQRNKNITIIPLLAKKLKDVNFDFHFLLTAEEDNSNDHKNFIKLLKENKVEDRVSIIGRVAKSDIPALFEKTDIVFLLSKLESFSNNIIEAWHFKRPLVITDAFWSRGICGDGAVYVNRDDSDEIVKEVIELVTKVDYRNRIVSNGNKMLATYPTIEERTISEINFLKEVYENG